MAFHSDVLCDKVTVWHASTVNYCIIVEQIFENMFKLKCYDTAQEDGGLICKKWRFGFVTDQIVDCMCLLSDFLELCLPQ